MTSNELFGEGLREELLREQAAYYQDLQHLWDNFRAEPDAMWFSWPSFILMLYNTGDWQRLTSWVVSGPGYSCQ